MISSSAAAQTAPPVPQLDHVIVTASRTAQLESSVLGDITVIDNQELDQAGQSSIAEVLARHPAVQFYNSGGPQTVTGVYLRGAGPSQTLVLVDGIRINSSTQGGANWNAIDPATIDHIEIIRGAASSLYGSDALGGVINIITRKPHENQAPSAWANMGYGSYGTSKSSLGFSGAERGWDYGLSSSLAQSSGFNASNRDNPNFNSDADGYSQHSLSGALGYSWAPGHRVGVTALNNYTNGDYDAGELHPAYSITRQQAYTVSSTDDLTSFWQSMWRFGLSKEYVEDRSYHTRYSSLQRSYTWQNNLKLTQDQHLSVVLERLEERPQYSPGFSINRRDTNSAGLVYRGDFGAHHVQASARNDTISGYGNQLTGGLSYQQDLSDQWRVGLAGNTGFRAPTFIDLYSPFAPNPELKPEKSRNIEFNLHYTADSVRLGLAAFQNKIADMITLDPNRNWAAFNIDAATIRGITLTGEKDYGKATLRIGADFMNPRDDQTGNQLARRARQTYRASVDYRLKSWTVGPEYLFVGKRYDDAANQTSLGGYGLLNVTAAYSVTPNVAIQVRWNNLLNKDYTNAYGYNAPGSNVFINVAWRL
ncbi:MAG TPA: TonB-dependent receptor [Paralcaligenes sp.]